MPGMVHLQTDLVAFQAAADAARTPTKPLSMGALAKLEQVGPHSGARGARAPGSVIPVTLERPNVTGAEEANLAVFAQRGWEARARQWTPEAHVLCSVLASSAHRVLHERKHPPGTPAVVGVLDVAMGDWTWMPSCLVDLMTHLGPSNISVAYHGVDVVPSAVLAAERRRDELLRRLPGVSVRFSLIDLTGGPVGALARAARGEHAEIVLCHRLLDHLYNGEVSAFWAAVGRCGPLWALAVGLVRFADLC